MSKWKQLQEEDTAPVQDTEKTESLESIEKSFKDALNTDELLKSFAERREKESGRMTDIVDTNYYFVVCFNNMNQLVEFCETFNLNPDEIYMDGRDFARRVNRELQEPDIELPRTQPLNKDYFARSLE